jgi:hypothetical protein
MTQPLKMTKKIRRNNGVPSTPYYKKEATLCVAGF